MYGLSRYLGIGPTVRLAGREFGVFARRVRDYAVIESRIMSLRGNPFDNLRWISGPGSDRDSVVRVFGKLRDGWWDVTLGETLSFLDSWDGRCLALSLAIREPEPFVRRAILSFMSGCDSIWDRESAWDPFQQAMDTANGDDELGLLKWVGKDDDGEQKAISWPQIFRDLAEAPFHRSDAEIAEMTLTQIRTLQGSRSSLAPTPTFARQTESDAWSAKQETYAIAAAENLSSNLHWGTK